MRFLALLVLVAACSEQDSIEPGLLAPNYGRVDAAPSVALGAPLLVHIETFGDGCVKFERTDIDVTPEAVDVWPFDRFHHPGANEGCTQILNHYTHDVMLTFSTLGTKTITVHGSIERGFDTRDDYPWPLSVVVDCPGATCVSSGP